MEDYYFFLRRSTIKPRKINYIQKSKKIIKLRATRSMIRGFIQVSGVVIIKVSDVVIIKVDMYTQGVFHSIEKKMAYFREQQDILRLRKEHLLIEKEALQEQLLSVTSDLQDLDGELESVQLEMHLLWEQEQELLEYRMEELNSRRKRIKGDGSCVFRSTSDQHYGTQENHPEFRSLACEQLLRWKDLYVNMYYVTEAEYLAFVDDLAWPYTWANGVAIKALADALNVTFEVIVSDLDHAIDYIHPTYGESSTVYRICSSHQHWDSLYKNDDDMPLSPERLRHMASTGLFYSSEIMAPRRHTRFGD